jgi:hypothetical protein
MLLRRASASKGERKPLTFEIRTKIKYVSEQSASRIKMMSANRSTTTLHRICQLSLQVICSNMYSTVKERIMFGTNSYFT